MRFGVTLPNVGVGEEPRILADLACDAEEAGWDGAFLWDTPFAPADDERVAITHEAWIGLATMALATERITLGTMITPLAWRRPHLVARQAVTMDRLSRGRFVLATGLGAPDAGGTAFGEPTDRRTRARMLDEALAILERCWSGERFSFDGEHHRVQGVRFLPTPIERIPVWVVGAWHRDPEAWPRKRSLRRALRWDGVLPNIFDHDGVTFEASSDDLRAMVDWIRAEREEPFEVIQEAGSQTDDNTPAEEVRAWRDAGATWWLEPVWWSMYRHPGDPEPMRERIRRGPPVL